MKWTEEETIQCCSMVRKGKTYKEIAEAMDRTPHAVKMFISRERQKAPYIWRKVNHGKRTAQQLCETCYFASGAYADGFKCPWADHFEPVPGWEAKPTVHWHQNNDSFYKMESYEITGCPKYRRG